MGLTVNHGCFNSPYSTFDWWRRRIAITAGIPIERMDGYCEDESLTPIPWDLYEPDILIALLVHCDNYDGIAAESCGPLADRLQQLLDVMIAKSEDETEEQIITSKFIRGLRRAARKNNWLELA